MKEIIIYLVVLRLIIIYRSPPTERHIIGKAQEPGQDIQSRFSCTHALR